MSVVTKYENWKKLVMKKRNEAKMNKSSREVFSEFHGLFRPYVNRIYRGALILTWSPKTAEKLQTEIYIEAFMQYSQGRNLLDFKTWLLEIVDDCFSTRKSQNNETLIEKDSHKRAIELIAADF